MRAAQIVAHREPLVGGEVPDPKCEAGGAIVQVEANGLCRSDRHTWKGDWAWFGELPALPVIPGHEFGGTVVEVGADVRRVRSATASRCRSPRPAGTARAAGAGGPPSVGPSSSPATCTAAGTGRSWR